MPRKSSVERQVALCYVRLSVTKDASDLTSPERQRANIEVACAKYGWYRNGTRMLRVTNRPLKKKIGLPGLLSKRG
jgi:hypothetical protein